VEDFYSLEIVEKAREILKLKLTEREDLSEARCVQLEPHINYFLEIPLEDKENENNCLVSYFEN
jgi:hypothetical protein